MPEPAAPRPDPGPATTRPRPSPNGTAPPMPWEVTTAPNGTAPPKPPVPPMPSEVTTAHPRAPRPAADVFGTAMSPLRKLMHRAPRHA